MYAATTKDEGNTADGRFSTACSYVIHPFWVIWVLMSWIGLKFLFFIKGLTLVASCSFILVSEGNVREI
jgi:hypothetical protein